MVSDEPHRRRMRDPLTHHGRGRRNPTLSADRFFGVEMPGDWAIRWESQFRGQRMCCAQSVRQSALRPCLLEGSVYGRAITGTESAPNLLTLAAAGILVRRLPLLVDFRMHGPASPQTRHDVENHWPWSCFPKSSRFLFGSSRACFFGFSHGRLS